MADWWPVLAMAAALGAVWLGATALSRRRGDDRPIAPDDLGPFPAVLLFTAEDCASCPPVRDAVARATGGRFAEYTWQVHPGILGRLRIDRVPTTWVVAADGRVASTFEGSVDEGAIRRAIR